MKKKLDNDHIPDKILLRKNFLPKKEIIRVLECYAGHGILWDLIRKDIPCIELLRIEKENKRAGSLRGDNMKWLPAIDVNSFDVIDLDSYGSPIAQLQHLFDRGYKGIVHITFIQSGMGSLPLQMLEKIGISKNMRKKSPILCSTNPFQKIQDYLSLMNVDKIHYISHQRKHYICFEMR